MNKDPKPWQVLHSEYLYQHPPWLTVRKDKVQLPTGATIDDFYILEYPDWVSVLAITTDERMVVIRQHRHALGRTHFELPAGVIDEEDGDPEIAARRELLEETGFGGGQWQPWMIGSANSATHTNLTHTYLAKNVTKVQEPQLDSGEDIQVHLLPLPEVRELCLANAFVQSLHSAGILKYFLLHAQS